MGLVKEFIFSIGISMEQIAHVQEKPRYLPCPPCKRPQEEEPPLSTHPLTFLSLPKGEQKDFFSLKTVQ